VRGVSKALGSNFSKGFFQVSVSKLEVMSKQKENKWSNYALRIIVNTASHPFEYAKVLIQIGYEPIAPRPAKTFFGKPALKIT